MARAASKLARAKGVSVFVEAWEAAYNLHIHGFHEHSLEVEDVQHRLPVIEKFVDLCRRMAKGVLGEKARQGVE